MAKGRPRMTEQEKADAKAAREAAKAGASAAADRAEARADAKKPPTNAPKPAERPSKPRLVNPELDQEEKALFLQFLPEIKELRAKLATANSNLRNRYKSAKAQGGFTKADFDTAIAVETAEAEARERAAIARKMKIAKYMGSDIGDQLDMFLEPNRTPASDRSYQEGESDAMQNKPARPLYDPSTEQARRYLEGYHSVSEKRIMDGIGKLHPAVEEDLKATAEHKAEIDASKAQDAAVFDAAPSSGVPMTRAQFRAQQEAAKDGTKH